MAKLTHDAVLPGLSVVSGAKVVAGDVNLDGMSDLLLVGGTGWNVIWTGVSNSNGTFTTTSATASTFPTLAQAANVKVVAGDFDNNGRMDVALAGGSGWNSVPLALRQPNGSWQVKTEYVPDIPAWAQAPGAKLLAGDTNLDGKWDLLLTGGSGWYTVPVATSNGNGTFSVANNQLADFPGWAQQAGVTPVSGDYNNDNRVDIALIGGSSWITIPVASGGSGSTFMVTNRVSP